VTAATSSAVRSPNCPARILNADRRVPQWRDVLGVVLDSVVEEGGARHVRVGDVVVAENPDRDPEQVVRVRLALPAVPRVKSRHQRDCAVGAAPVCRQELRDLDLQPFVQVLQSLFHVECPICIGGVTDDAVTAVTVSSYRGNCPRA
jgi:hypothetical protein